MTKSAPNYCFVHSARCVYVCAQIILAVCCACVFPPSCRTLCSVEDGDVKFRKTADIRNLNIFATCCSCGLSCILLVAIRACVSRPLLRAIDYNTPRFPLLFVAFIPALSITFTFTLPCACPGVLCVALMHFQCQSTAVCYQHLHHRACCTSWLSS